MAPLRGGPIQNATRSRPRPTINNAAQLFTYDLAGRLKTRRDALNHTTAFAYNAYGLPTLIDYPTDVDVAFTYDQQGRRLSMTDGSGATSWTYDAFGRTATETQGHVKRVLRFSYDGDSERTGLEIVPTTGGTPWETSYGYDNAGRLHSVLDGRISSGQPYVYAYAPNASLVAQVTTPTGQKVIKTYDPLARLLNTTGQQANGTVFSSFTYSYNVAGQRQK